MKKILVILIFFATFTGISHAQEDVVQNIEKMSLVHQDKITTQEYALKLQRYLILKPYILDGDTMYQYLLPELPIYAPLKFKNNRQRKKYNKLVHNVKTVLPIAHCSGGERTDKGNLRNPATLARQEKQGRTYKGGREGDMENIFSKDEETYLFARKTAYKTR